MELCLPGLCDALSSKLSTRFIVSLALPPLVAFPLVFDFVPHWKESSFRTEVRNILVTSVGVSATC